MMTPDMMDEERRQFGHVARFQRSRVLRISIEELARRASCTPAGVRSLEEGNPTGDLQEIARICDALGVLVPIIYSDAIF
jgi:transcriptional regulator with XRE-family HTH domain